VLVALLLLRQIQHEEREERVENVAGRTEQMCQLHEVLRAPEVVLVGPRHLRTASEAFARQACGDMIWFNASTPVPAF
jgi:hypothetical protein